MMANEEETTMSELSQQHCEACRAGAPKISDAELRELMPKIPDWEVVVVDGVMRLSRDFKFADFVGAMAFSNRVGDLAEEAGHHPAILTEWGKVNVSWWTHKIKGLHKNDLIMAARTDDAYDAD
jgi:4a-hydroxytetrahydrobiopterin dehydratase